MKKIKLLIIFLLVLTTSSCFMKQRDLTKIAFPISLFIAHENDKYQLYLLVLSHSLSSRIELESNEDKALYHIIKVEGETLDKASEKIGIINEGNVSVIKLRSIVLHESLFNDPKFDYETFSAYIINNPLYKSNIYLYYTKENPIDFLNLNSLTFTIDTNFYLTRPDKTYYNDFLKPPTLIDSAKSYLDNKRMFYLPSLAISNATFYKQENDELVANYSHYMNGALFLSKNGEFNFIEIENLTGLKWKYELEYFDYHLDEYENAHFKIEKNYWQQKIVNNKVEVKINVIVKTIFNYTEFSISELEELIKKQIEKEVIATYNGTNDTLDIYLFNDLAYRKHKKIDSDFNLEVKVTIKNTIYQY